MIKKYACEKSVKLRANIKGKNMFFSEEPDSDMEAILRNCQVRTVYLLGSLLHLDGLRRARIHDATALLFVTNKNSVDPEREDSTAIMTAASVKNFNPYLRCVVQLLQTSSKVSRKTRFPHLIHEEPLHTYKSDSVAGRTRH